MRTLLFCSLIASGCADPATAPRTFAFGPFHLEPGAEVTDRCVSMTLGNDEALYVNAVELATATGVHHANWFWVPERVFPGPDGEWPCSERGYAESVAGVLGSVVFAMSTQATHERQAFPDGVVIHVPPHSKLVAGLHLMNATDAPLDVPLSLTLESLAERDVTTKLAGFSLENQGLAIPPGQLSRFTVECDMNTRHQQVFGRPIDFKIYYVLPHYHALGAGLTIEAIRDSDGGADTVWTTAHRIGDAIGGPLDPPFDLTGHSRLRFSCTFDNPRDVSVGWGVGDQEMCMALTFTDSAYTWQAGELAGLDPGPGVSNGNVRDFTAANCDVRSADATR